MKPLTLTCCICHLAPSLHACPVSASQSTLTSRRGELDSGDFQEDYEDSGSYGSKSSWNIADIADAFKCVGRRVGPPRPLYECMVEELNYYIILPHPDHMPYYIILTLLNFPRI